MWPTVMPEAKITACFYKRGGFQTTPGDPLLPLPRSR